jgi:mono/diheme cytochrome c family protein
VSSRRSRRSLLVPALLAGAAVFVATLLLGLSLLTLARSGSGTRTATVPLGDPFAGARVFVNAGCDRCHTLAVAGAHGIGGPNLDEHFRGHGHALAAVIEQVTNGSDGMPAFGRRLTPSQIRDVSTFIVEVAGQGVSP